jgi:hypothetical protein
MSASIKKSDQVGPAHLRALVSPDAKRFILTPSFLSVNIDLTVA